MAYDPTKDFMALSRLNSGALEWDRIPGLDYVMSALARSGLFRMHVSQTPPDVNQPNTVWFKTSVPSWVAEGAPFIYDGANWKPATPALWGLIIASSAAGNQSYQSVTVAAADVEPRTTLLAINRVAPAITTLQLPSVLTAREVCIVDWSTGIVEHQIVALAASGETVMRGPSWNLFSTPDQRASARFVPSIDLNGWVVL